MQYKNLVDLYEFLENNPARLKKVDAIADFLEKCGDDDLPMVTLLAQGTVFPSWSSSEIGVASKLMIWILSVSTGFSESVVSGEFNKTGDLGLVAEDLIKKKRQRTLFAKPLAVKNVFENLQKLAETEGSGSQDRKASLISELISSASPKEAKYITRTVLGELRIGVAEGVVRDAIAKAFFADVLWMPDRIAEIIKSSSEKSFLVETGLFDKTKIDGKTIEAFKKRNDFKEADAEKMAKADPWKRKSKTDFLLFMDDKVGAELKSRIVDTIEWAWFLKPDYSEIAKAAKESGLEGLKKIKIELGKPIHVLLAEKAPSLEEAIGSFDRVAIEVKYDGMRTQIHKKGDKIWLYTRRLENVTNAFPDLVDLVRKHIKVDKCVIEGETIGIDPKTGSPVPFQNLSQRIHRKYNIHEMKSQIPIQVNLFDIMFLGGDVFFDKPLSERRESLKSIVKVLPDKFQLAEQLVTKDLKKAEDFYQKALKSHQEGVMVKNLDAIYQPGKRVAGGWLKVKPVMETLDLAIIGGQWGTGKRAGWLGSFVLACRDSETGRFLPCGMLGTGIKEKKTLDSDMTLEELTNILKDKIVYEKGSDVTIKPSVVIEVAYEEIQKSPNYASGYALRFPRFLRMRWDRDVKEADDLDRLKELFRQQKGKHNKDFTKQ
jgi:ATP-dependent DNA ligase I